MLEPQTDQNIHCEEPRLQFLPLVFNHIGYCMFREVVLHNKNIPDNRFLMETYNLLDSGEVNMEELTQSTTW